MYRYVGYLTAHLEARHQHMTAGFPRHNQGPGTGSCL
jgi:hypothetical protein